MSPDQEVRQIKLDKIKLEQTLQQKVQEYVQMKLKAFEAMDKVKKLEAAVSRKDMRLRGQHNELVGLGALKKEADAYHFEASQNLEKELSKVKKENTNLENTVARASLETEAHAEDARLRTGRSPRCSKKEKVPTAWPLV
eukprot:TRINITY_DN2196_c0_g1_i5.p1 TRINITY_DN2196_c0_g1~~TRINITY_DN2196_c0_g1_i5.p1  ORF type:complete len:152 (-),score=43.82 TRINITY_DN2196_c0_g1_i5:28-447(-)